MTDEEMKQLILTIRETNDTELTTMEVLSAVLKARHYDKTRNNNPDDGVGKK